MLRASCDRCRRQKLRCITTPEDPTGPCQRCAKAKMAEHCVYALRTRTSGVQSSNGEATLSASRRENGASRHSLPGMSQFSIDLSAKASPSFADNSTAPNSYWMSAQQRTDGIVQLNPDTHRLSQTNMISSNGASNSNLASHDVGARYPDSSMSFSPDFSNWLLCSPETGLPGESYLPGASYGESTNVANPLHDQSRQYHASPQHLLSMQLNALGNVIRPHALVAPTHRPSLSAEMSALLAEASTYEIGLRKSTDSDLDAYPIGDAIFLAQRFRDLLNAYNDSVSDGLGPDAGAPPSGLTYPCYRVMIQIYIAVFTFLHRHVSRPPDAPLVDHDHPQSPLRTVAADVHSYRGLRLGQLQLVCLCSAWDPVRKAVSMLVSALGGAEAALSLATDLCVVDSVQPSGSTQPGSGARRGVFEEDMSYSLRDRRLQSHMREKARELRSIVEEVQDLL